MWFHWQWNLSLRNIWSRIYMELISSLLVLLFTIQLKLKCATNGFNYFNRHYGADCLQLYRRLHVHIHNSSTKINKLELDLDFLRKYRAYNVFPKFLRSNYTKNRYKLLISILPGKQNCWTMRSSSKRKTSSEQKMNSRLILLIFGPSSLKSNSTCLHISSSRNSANVVLLWKTFIGENLAGLVSIMKLPPAIQMRWYLIIVLAIFSIMLGWFLHLD